MLNKVKVMQKQLALFHNAVASYYAGNQQALESTIKQFNIRLKPPTQPSWLEEHKWFVRYYLTFLNYALVVSLI